MFENYKFEDLLFHIIKKWKIVLITCIAVFILVIGFFKISSNNVGKESNKVSIAYTLKAKDDFAIYTNDGYQKSVGNTIKLNHEFINSGIFSDLVYKKLEDYYTKDFIEKNVGKNSTSITKAITSKTNASTELLIVEIETSLEDLSSKFYEITTNILSNLEANQQFNLITIGNSKTSTVSESGKIRMIHYLGAGVLSLSAAIFLVFILHFFNPTINYISRLNLFHFGNFKNMKKMVGNINFYTNKNSINDLAIVSIEKDTKISDLHLQCSNLLCVDNYFKDQDALERLTPIKNVIICIKLGKTTFNDFNVLVDELYSRDINVLGVIYN